MHFKKLISLKKNPKCVHFGTKSTQFEKKNQSTLMSILTHFEGKKNRGLFEIIDTLHTINEYLTLFISKCQNQKGFILSRSMYNIFQMT